MIWLSVCCEDLTTPVIFEDGAMNVKRDIEEVLPVARKCIILIIFLVLFRRIDGRQIHLICFH